MATYKELYENLQGEFNQLKAALESKAKALKDCKAKAAVEPLHYNPIEYYLEKTGNPHSYQELLEDYAKVLAKLNSR